MANSLHSFIHLVFIGFIALFPVVNPFGTAFMVNPYLANLSHKERIRVVKRIVFYAFSICVVTLFTGHWILELFGLSVPVIQVAGGFMICKIGWEFLSSDKSVVQEETVSVKADVTELSVLESKLFYPITFPMTTGAGVIAVLFTLSANGDAQNISEYLLNTGAILVSIIAICILIFFFYINANRLITHIGTQNEAIVNRLMAFLIFCVGLQIAVGGITHLIKG